MVAAEPPRAPVPVRPAVVRETVGTTGFLDTERRVAAPPLSTLRRPESNDGVWIRYAGSKWVSAGAAVPFAATDFQHVGEYGTFPVFARETVNEEIIYLPTSRAGYVAPYRLKD
jgi:hypothetical protein